MHGVPWPSSFGLALPSLFFVFVQPASLSCSLSSSWINHVSVWDCGLRRWKNCKTYHRETRPSVIDVDAGVYDGQMEFALFARDIIGPDHKIWEGIRPPRAEDCYLDGQMFRSCARDIYMTGNRPSPNSVSTPCISPAPSVSRPKWGPQPQRVLPYARNLSWGGSGRLANL